MYKALIVDVDRTLVTSKKALPTKKVKDAIFKAKNEKNIYISLATARPYTQIKDICHDLQLSGLSIVSGGAQIVDMQTGSVYREYCLSYQTIQEIARIVKNVDSNIVFWVQDNNIDYPMTNSYTPYKPLVMVISNLLKEQVTEIKNQLAHLPGIFVTKAKPYNKDLLDLNITNEHATKQNGIMAIAEKLHLTKEQIVGVGDGHNDHPLFQASGLKIAMGNAVPEIKEVADYTAPSVDEDGLAHVIQKYFFNHVQQTP